MILEFERIVAEHDVAVKKFDTDTALEQDTHHTVAMFFERVDNTRVELVRLEKRMDELDRKLWTITCLFIAALLSLAATLIVQIIKKESHLPLPSAA